MRLLEYWADQPPLSEIACAYFGLKPKVKPPSYEDRDRLAAMHMQNKEDPSGIGGLIRQFPNGFVPANR